MSISSLFLNWLIIDEFTTASGKLFHIFTIYSVKSYFLMSYLTLLVVYSVELGVNFGTVSSSKTFLLS